MKKNFLTTGNTMKDRISKAIFGAVMTANLVMYYNTTTVSAAAFPVLTKTGITGIDNSIGKLIGLFTGVVSAFGIILLIRNAIEFFTALQDRDSGSMKQAGLGMLAGFGIASISGVLTFLGFTW